MSKGPPMILGRLSNNDGDSNGNENRKKATGLY